eukprot:g3767.t1
MLLQHIVLCAVLINTFIASSGVVFGGASLGISITILGLTGAFLSYATAIFGPLIDWRGPRETAVIGTLLSSCGYFCLIVDNTPDGDGTLALIGYGLVSSGGTATYLSGFTVSNTFQHSSGVVGAAISGLYTFSGLNADLLGLLLGNDNTGGIHDGITSFLFFLQFLALCLVIAFYPAKSYSPGDKCSADDILSGKILISCFGEFGGAKCEPLPSPTIDEENGKACVTPQSRRHSFVYEPSTQPSGVFAIGDVEDDEGLDSTESIGRRIRSKSEGTFEVIPLEIDDDLDVVNLENIEEGKVDIVMPSFVKHKLPALGDKAFAHGIVPPSFWRGIKGRKLVASLRQRALATFGERKEVEVQRSFTEEVVTLEFWGMTGWYAFHLALLVYYFFSVVFWVKQPSNFAVVAGWIGNGLPGILGPFSGVFINKFGFRISVLVCNGLAAGMILLLILENSMMNYLSLLLFCAHRTILFAIFFAYIPIRFGGTHYGKLVGLATVVAGTVGLFLGPLMETMLGRLDFLLFAAIAAKSSGVIVFL